MALAASSASYCCNQLFAALGSKVSFPGNGTYALTESSYWSLQEAALTPSCIATPYNTEDAGQGHAPAASFVNVNEGVTIDTTLLNTTTLNANASVVSVGAGCSWSDVYNYLNPFGLAAAGGRNGAVISSQGRHKQVGASNPCRSAHYPTKHHPRVAESISQISAYLKAFADIANATSYDEYASLVTGLTFNSTSKEWSLATAAAYTKPGTSNTTIPAVYQELFSIPSAANTVAVVNISTLAAEAPIPAFICNTTIHDFTPAGSLLRSLAFEPLPTILTSRGAGKNSLGTSGADGNGVVLLLSALWTDSSSSEAINDRAGALLADIDAAAGERGMLRRFRYANYAGPGQRALRSYGERDFEFLRRVSGV
ncbi:hypothetical protein BDV97DRAFT_365945 [Delphinella strobiligena]|nr:hypothetical protein BDV97DRAFT_365945 [Delphinella strobiligena]